MRLFWLKVILVGLFRQGNIVHGSCVTSPKTNIFGQDNIAAIRIKVHISLLVLGIQNMPPSRSNRTFQNITS